MTLKDVIRYSGWSLFWLVVTVIGSALAQSLGVDETAARADGKYWFGIAMGVLSARYVIWPEKFHREST